MTNYPETAGWKDDTVSKDNAIEGGARFSRMQKRVLDLFMGGFVGTADDVAGRLHLSPFSSRPRCSELVKLGEIRRLRRDTSTPGRHAWVLAIAEKHEPIDDLPADLFDDDGQPDEQQEWLDFDRDC